MKRLLFLLLLTSLHISAEELPRSPVCWPPNFTGVVPGVTTDAQVQRLLGRGISSKEAEFLSRTYIDAKGTATLKIKTQGSVTELSVEAGLPKLSAAERKRAQTRWFNPQEQFGNRHELHLGSSKKQVRENLGEPQDAISDSRWEYQSKCACELPIYFTLYFQDDAVSKIVLTAEAD